MTNRTAIQLQGKGLLQVIAGLFLAGLSACGSGEKVAGGGGIETVGLTGTAFYPGGVAAENARVIVREKTYLTLSQVGALAKKSVTWVRRTEARTDKEGRYRVDSLSPGEYSVEITDEISHAALVDVEMDKLDDTVVAARATLKAFSTLTGVVLLDSSARKEAHVQVSGMERLTRIGEDGRFAFQDLPEGFYDVRLENGLAFIAAMETTGVETRAGQTTDLGVWKVSETCPNAWCDSSVVQHVLRVAGLSRFPVGSVATFEGNPARITGLNLDGVGLTSLPVDVYRLKTLRVLSVEGNDLTGLPEELGRLPSLEALRLSGNRIAVFPESMSDLKTLRELKAVGNALSSLPSGFAALDGMQSLDLSRNRICGLPAELDAWITRLQSDWKAAQTCP